MALFDSTHSRDRKWGGRERGNDMQERAACSEDCSLYMWQLLNPLHHSPPLGNIFSNVLHGHSVLFFFFLNFIFSIKRQFLEVVPTIFQKSLSHCNVICPMIVIYLFQLFQSGLYLWRCLSKYVVVHQGHWGSNQERLLLWSQWMVRIRRTLILSCLKTSLKIYLCICLVSLGFLKGIIHIIIIIIIDIFEIYSTIE